MSKAKTVRIDLLKRRTRRVKGWVCRNGDGALLLVESVPEPHYIGKEGWNIISADLLDCWSTRGYRQLYGRAGPVPGIGRKIAVDIEIE